MSGLLDDVRVDRGLPPPERAREIRSTAGVSRARLATELGVHEVTIARWERGTRVPRGRLRVEYARLLRSLATELQEEGS